MKIITGGRQSGKTLKLILISAKTGKYIVCQNQNEAKRIFDIAQKKNLDIPFPLTFDELKNHRYRNTKNKGMLLDNADVYLNYISNGLIDGITITNPQD